MRIGFGYDSHRLVDGRALILGGVHISYAKGLLGHSDADVVLHAISDALLGAAALGDIGQHFPDSDSTTEGIASTEILRHVRALLAAKGYTIGNIDVTICAEQPTLAPHIPAMRTAIAAVLGIDQGSISIKATTNEGMGFVGRTEGIATYAVALITSNN